jgi:hypothetical protein
MMFPGLPPPPAPLVSAPAAPVGTRGAKVSLWIDSTSSTQFFSKKRKVPDTPRPSPVQSVRQVRVETPANSTQAPKEQDSNSILVENAHSKKKRTSTMDLKNPVPVSDGRPMEKLCISRLKGSDPEYTIYLEAMERHNPIGKPKNDANPEIGKASTQETQWRLVQKHVATVTAKKGPPSWSVFFFVLFFISKYQKVLVECAIQRLAKFK